LPPLRVKKGVKPYFTTYPTARWYWFDVAVFGEHLPHIGDLATAVFERLSGGLTPRAAGAKSYLTREDAEADLKQALTAKEKERS
jgi:hypothetical protein